MCGVGHFWTIAAYLVGFAGLAIVVAYVFFGFVIGLNEWDSGIWAKLWVLSSVAIVIAGITIAVHNDKKGGKDGGTRPSTGTCIECHGDSVS